jgi:hypothetical protein
VVILRSDIEKRLDDLISNEEGMRFQGLGVVLAKKRWPELIACERKKDFGVDAIARATLAPDGVGKALACSITATLQKIREDATEAKKHFDDIQIFVFATPKTVTNQKKESWATKIQKDFDYQLIRTH